MIDTNVTIGFKRFLMFMETITKEDVKNLIVAADQPIDKKVDQSYAVIQIYTSAAREALARPKTMAFLLRIAAAIELIAKVFPYNGNPLKKYFPVTYKMGEELYKELLENVEASKVGDLIVDVQKRFEAKLSPQK